MANSEISNMEVRATIAALPPFITRWSNLVVLGLLLSCLLLTRLISFKNITHIKAEMTAVNNSGTTGAPGFLTAAVELTKDQARRIGPGMNFIMNVQQVDIAIVGRVSGVDAGPVPGHYQLRLRLDTQSTARFRSMNKAIFWGTQELQVIRLNETVLGNILSSYKIVN